MRPSRDLDPLRRHALRDELAARGRRERFGALLDRAARALVERQLERRFAHRDAVSQADAIGREHACERVDENARHPELVGDLAGVLAGRAAEAAERVARDVVPALHRDVFDRIRHVRHRDVDEALGHGFRRPVVAGGAADLGRERGEFFAHDLGVERRIAPGPEDAREELRLDLAEHDVRVGDRERPAAAVAGRPGVRARGIGPDAVPRPVEVQDRAAAGRDRVDRHHRGAHAHAGDPRLELALELAGEVRDVGRRSAHVETDDAVEPRCGGGAHRADDTARGAREDRILALEAAGVGEPPVRLHEEEPHAGQLGGDLVDVAAQDRREVGIGDGGVAAGDELHQRARLVRHRHLREPDRARRGGERRLVLRVAVAVHQHHRHRAEALVPGRLEIAPRRCDVEGNEHVAARAEALVHLDHLRVEHLRQHDAAGEELRPVLVADAQGVGEAARDEEHRRLALALEERVGGHGRAHLHHLDRARRDRLAGRHADELADRRDRGVAVALRVLREELVRDERAVRAQRHDVGERPAAVDPELPAARHGRGWKSPAARVYPRRMPRPAIASPNAE